MEVATKAGAKAESEAKLKETVTNLVNWAKLSAEEREKRIKRPEPWTPGTSPPATGEWKGEGPDPSKPMPTTEMGPSWQHRKKANTREEIITAGLFVFFLLSFVVIGVLFPDECTKFVGKLIAAGKEYMPASLLAGKPGTTPKTEV